MIPEASLKALRTVARVLKYALDNGIQHVLFYGDVGDKPRLSYFSQVHLYQLILSRRYKDLTFHFILGNHDFAEDGTHTLQVLEVVADKMGRNVHVYTKPEVVRIEGVKFNFLPYPYTDTRKDCINVGHFEVSGSLRDNGRKIEEGPSKKHVTLMGHLHTCHRVRNTYFSGTLYQTNFGEALPKSFHHVRTQGPQKTHVENVRVTPPWELHNVSIETRDDLDKLSAADHILYKAYFKEGIDLDVNKVLIRYPNIIKHNVFRSKKDLAMLVSKEWSFDDNDLLSTVNVDKRAMLRDFMIHEGSLAKDQIKRGMQIYKRLST